MKKRSAKLQLNRETLRLLPIVHRVAGGNDTEGTDCESDYCNTQALNTCCCATIQWPGFMSDCMYNC